MTTGTNGTAPFRLRVFLAGTEFFREGGIQSVNRLLGRAFCEIGASTPLDLHVFALHDGNSKTGFACHEPITWHTSAGRPSILLREFASALLRVRPHLVLFTHVSLARLVALVHLLCPRTRTALLAHGAEVWLPLAASQRAALRRLDALVVPSEFTRGKLVASQQLDRARIALLPHGLDPDWAAAGQRPAAREGTTMLSVARLCRDDLRYGSKGIELTLQAMPHILSRCPAARYVVVGDGDDRSRLMRLAHEMGVAQAVRFRGTLQAVEVLDAYAQADVFVLPTTLEGFGIVFLEAMHCGLPVVAARAGATPEVVADGETGILVEPDSVESLGSAVSGLLLLADERERMGAAGRRRVASQYRFEHFTARWHRWLAAVIPQPVYLARHAAAYFQKCVGQDPAVQSNVTSQVHL